MNEHEQAAAAAAAAIEEILKQLELRTGMLIKALALRAIDVTTLSDDNSRHLMSVHIELFRVPGHDWC